MYRYSSIELQLGLCLIGEQILRGTLKEFDNELLLGTPSFTCDKGLSVTLEVMGLLGLSSE